MKIFCGGTTMKISERSLRTGRRGQSGLIATAAIIIALALVVGLGFFIHDRFWGSPSQQQTTFSIANSGGAGTQSLAASGNNCGSTKTSTLQLTQHNGLNSSGDEIYNQTCQFYSVDANGKENHVGTIGNTDGSNSAISPTCGGSPYVLRC